MTGRENRRARREAERNAKKRAAKQEKLAPPSPAENSPAPQIPPTAAAYLAEQRAKADRELEAEFGAEFVAHARELGDRIARRAGLFVPDRSRTEVNRQNAQLSTGPRTQAGKLASSRNSLKHGLSTGALLIPGEDQAEFEALRDALRRDHQPAGATEQLLVDGMAQSHWLLQRALRFQNECFTAGGVDEKRLALFIRYATTHERAFHKALTALLRIQKDRNGFVSQSNSSEHRNARKPATGKHSAPFAESEACPKFCAPSTFPQTPPSDTRNEESNHGRTCQLPHLQSQSSIRRSEHAIL